MSNYFKRTIECLLVFTFGSLIVHTVVMLIDYYLLVGGDMYSSKKLVYGLFARSMIPMMFAYGSLSLMVFVLWKKLTSLRDSSLKQKMETEKQKEILRAIQSLTGLIVEQIAGHNTLILEWIAKQKDKGRQVSLQLQDAANGTSIALRGLTKSVFCVDTKSISVDTDIILRRIEHEIELRKTC